MDAGQTTLPAGLADMPPDPGLASVLSIVDRTALAAPQLAVVVMAQARQVSHEEARLLADAVELSRIPVGRAAPGHPRTGR